MDELDEQKKEYLKTDPAPWITDSTKRTTMIDATLEREKFMIAFRAFFPDCKFSELDGTGPNLYVNEVEYAPKKHAWAILFLEQPDEKPNTWVMLAKPMYKLAYEVDERSYATRENHFFTDDLNKLTKKLKELKKG